MVERCLPPTRLTLIAALAKGLRWEEFVVLYGRIILRWARENFGLQEADAENLRQEVLIRVWKGIASYDPAKGRFRNWLYACTRNAVCNLRRDWGTDHTRLLVDEIADPSALASPLYGRIDDGDLEKALLLLEEEGFSTDGLQGAIRSVRTRVQPKTWKAFLLFEFLDMKAKEIAPLVNLAPAAVNQAVHRVRQLLQEALPSGAQADPKRRLRHQ